MKKMFYYCAQTIIYIIVILLVSQLNTGHAIFNPDIVYPNVSGNATWSIVSYDDLTCPSSIQRYNPRQHQVLTHVTITRPGINLSLRISGYLCHKVQYSTICEMPWYFSPTITHNLASVSMRETECRDAVKDYIGGGHVPLTFPPEDCAWSSTNTKSHVEILVSEHSVLLDPYTNNYVDPIFPGGISSPGMGGTIHDNMMWVEGGGKLADSCKDWSTSYGVIYSDLIYGIREPITEVGLVHIEGHRDKNLTLACRLNFCGIEGVRFNDGEWMSMQTQTELPSPRTFHIGDMPRCPPDVTIQTAIVEAVSPELTEITSNMVYRMKCQDTISRLVSGIPVSALDLSYLVQVHEGPGYVYKRRDNILYHTIGSYFLIDTEPMNTEPGLLGVRKDGSKKYLRDWSSAIDGRGTQEGLNGVMLVNKKIIVPTGFSVRLEADTELMWGHPVHTVSHPLIHIISNHTDESVMTWTRGVNATNIIGLAERSITGYYKRVLWILISILVIGSIILLIFLKIIPLDWVIFILCPPLLILRYVKCKCRDSSAKGYVHGDDNNHELDSIERGAFR